MKFVEESVLDYCEQHTTAQSDLLHELERETHLKTLMPQMLAGSLQGKMLEFFSQMIRPKQVLEVGTFTGYSAICWAKGLQESGKVHTIEINEELEEMIREYMGKAGMTEKIELHIGSAMDIIPTLDGPFDLVYLDADKTGYAAYYDLVFDKVKTGGFIMADNVLWSGKVIDPDDKDEDTKALNNFSKKLMNDDRVECLMLPVRDGVMIARKL